MFVTFAVIAYNEETALPGLLGDLQEQDYPHDQMEVLLVDSASSDATRQIMEDFARENAGEFASARLLDNPKKTLPCGWNVVIREAKGEAIVRVDAHARIPADFVSKNVEVLDEGENVVGGQRPNVIDEATPWKETLNMAESSMFGSSFAAYRRQGKLAGTAGQDEKLYVDSVFHGMYRRSVFDTVGPYNETLKRTEDNEMHWRIRHAGMKIRFAPQIISKEHTRATLRSMLRQKAANGYWIALTSAVCPQCLSFFYFVPLLFTLLALIGTSISLIGLAFGIGPGMAAAAGTVSTAGTMAGQAGMASFVRTVQILTGILWALYITVDVLMSIAAAVTAKGKRFYFWALPVLFLLLHLSYGLGTLAGFLALPFKRKTLKKSSLPEDSKGMEHES